MIKQRLPQKETLDKSQPRDLFQTPNYATELLVPFIPKNIKYIWEVSAGEGKIVNVLKKHGYEVLASDIRDDLPNIEIYNFLTDNDELFTALKDKSAIITNPPYSSKRKFFQKCIEYELPFALLLSADYNKWGIDAVRKYSCIKIVPDSRINFITPTGLSEVTGHSSYFHSFWLTRFFIKPEGKQTEVFVELTKEMRKNV